MIGQVTPHGRTGQDGRNLVGHVIGKEPSARVEIMNSLGADLPDVIREMEIMRDGTRAESAYLHIVLSPGTALGDDEIRKAAQIVMKHFDAEDHPAALVFHDKERRGGQGDRHAHLVLGRVGPDGKPLVSGFEKIRLETAVRICEFELGEAPVLGEHFASSVRWLRKNDRVEIADWLESVHGADPDRPRSAASPSKRQALERQGLDLSAARESVKAAWSTADGAAAFHAAMSERGLSVTPGDKSGVWIVRSGETEIGALDRILGEKRKAVAERLQKEGKKNDVASPAPALEAVPVVAEKDAAADRPDDPVADKQGRTDRLKNRDQGRRDARPVDGRGAGGARGSDRGLAADPGFHPGPGRDDRDAAGHATGQPRQNGQALALARARLRQHDWTALRERAKPALVLVSERLDRWERDIVLRLQKAQRIRPESILTKGLREGVRKLEADLVAANAACDEAFQSMVAIKRPKGFWTMSPKAWFDTWQARGQAEARFEAAKQLRADLRAALKEKRRMVDPALAFDYKERRAERDAVVEAIRERDALDRRLLAAARAILRDDPALARKGVEAVLEAARQRLAEEEAQRRALSRQTALRPEPEPEPPTGWRP